METPVLRRQVNDVVCRSTPWAFADFNYCLKCLGFLAGYPQELSSYALRRGAANAVDCTVIPGELLLQCESPRVVPRFATVRYGSRTVAGWVFTP